MIHTASLLHDDVMDHAAHRRGVPALNSVHGNKLAILAGDFLLSRASLNLARYCHCEAFHMNVLLVWFSAVVIHHIPF